MRDPYFPYKLPTFRVREIIQRWMQENVPDWDFPTLRVAERTGFSEKRIRNILEEHTVGTNFNTVDKLLIGLDECGLWHVAKDDGGLADWYEATADNPLPEMPEPTAEQMARGKAHWRRQLAKGDTDDRLRKRREGYARRRELATPT